MENFFDKIDWSLLDKQKHSLLQHMEDLRHHYTGPKSKSINDDLVGILHLIDAVQDHAVDELNLSEKTVFPNM